MNPIIDNLQLQDRRRSQRERREMIVSAVLAGEVNIALSTAEEYFDGEIEILEVKRAILQSNRQRITRKLQDLGLRAKPIPQCFPVKQNSNGVTQAITVPDDGKI